MENFSTRKHRKSKSSNNLELVCASPLTKPCIAVYIRANRKGVAMASEKQDLHQVLEPLDRDEVWGQLAKLATNAVVIVVIAFIIAIICVGGS
jgi:hypothetical protein